MCSACRFTSGFLLALLFEPEDGADMFLRNTTLSQNYTMIQPKDRIVHNNRGESLKTSKIIVLIFIIQADASLIV
jgi:hypothetical protein